jgi:outer membrane protein assembly factor BamA
MLLVLGAGSLHAQPKTRAEEIDQARREKIARLWPERESPTVDIVNGLVERGLLDDSDGTGKNGFQIVLGGMRSGQGMSVGIGYRRTDIWNDRLAYRATARGTLQTAWMLDFELDFPTLRSERGYLTFYTKFESSPQMDYYGQGINSSQVDRTSYLADTFNFDGNAAYELFNNFRLGITGGFVDVHTGTGRNEPSTDEVFNPPGLEEDTYYLRWGGFVLYDYRDFPGGPKSGGLYAARLRQYDDRDLDKFNFKQAEFEFQQYIPYFNKTRVIAIRLKTTLSFADDRVVPFYLQPKLGGNDDLRSFARYRYYDNNYLIANVEHRWYAFSGLDVALFADAGTVANEKSDVDFSDMRYSGGIGLRVRLQDTVVMRIDFAYGDEGPRFMWTFSDIFAIRPFGNQ